MKRFLPAMLVLVVPMFAACGQKASTRTTAVTPAPVQSGPLHPMRAGAAHPFVSEPSQLHCGSEPVVWVNARSKVFHLQGDPYYGHTKSGGYMCEPDAEQAGYRAAKK